MKGYKYIILGGGVAAGYAAREFVKRDIKAGELGIISADDQLPYDRPSLSKGFLAGKSEMEDILINDADFYREHQIGVRLDDPVEDIDLEKKQLQTQSRNVESFERLLIATGSRVRKFDLPGAELKGLYYLRWLDDARILRAAAERAQRAIVIGGGFIGMEVASQLAQKAIKTTILFPEERLMERFFTPQMSAFFQRYYGDRGVSFITGAEIGSFVGEKEISAVVLRSGQELETDMVVAGIGVEPALELFEGTGLKLENGIVVNEYLETNLPDVYAAGDVANYYDVIFGKQRRIEHWDNAFQQGKHAATVMTGKREPFQKVPYFFSDIFDLSWEFWGDTEGAGQTIHRGSLESGSFSTWWLKERRVVAAFVMNRPEEEREMAPQWIKTGHQASPASLADETKSLR
jgi:NADPH-dependent 2,4-dienoyl-CoA reductase/sulfur reductase-like enzyme